MSRKKKSGVPSKQVLQAMRDWEFANKMYIASRGPIEKEHWRQKMLEAAKHL